MPALKAHRLDGYTVEFYKQHWDTLRNEVCEAILQFFNSSRMDDSINATNMVLIPENNNPKDVVDFRPISLYNVIYKIISKVLANNLKCVLPFIIAQNQSAFIPRRLITDSIWAAYETLHTMHTRMWSKVGFMGIKLDMSKAYDMVEWGFLEKVMIKMGFPPRWVKLIMECVNSVIMQLLSMGTRWVTSNHQGG